MGRENIYRTRTRDGEHGGVSLRLIVSASLLIGGIGGGLAYLHKQGMVASSVCEGVSDPLLQRARMNRAYRSIVGVMEYQSDSTRQFTQYDAATRDCSEAARSIDPHEADEAYPGVAFPDELK